MARELLFAAPGVDPDPWLAEIRMRWPELTIRIWPDVPDLSAIEVALAWGMQPQFWSRLPNLKAILSLGAGVDQLLAEPTLAPNVHVVRLVDDTMAKAMSRYVVHAVLHHTLDMDRHARQQEQASWRWSPPAAEARVCVLGLGKLGSEAAKALAALGFQVHGWSVSVKRLAGVRSFTGADALLDAVRGCNALVCLLPLTSQTQGILRGELFEAMAQGGAVINVGRGEHLVEDDLIAALDSKKLSGATLDVFCEEPLPPHSVLWSRKDVRITPHVAAVAAPASAAKTLADSVATVLRDERPQHSALRAQGY